MERKTNNWVTQIKNKDQKAAAEQQTQRQMAKLINSNICCGYLGTSKQSQQHIVRGCGDCIIICINYIMIWIHYVVFIMQTVWYLCSLGVLSGWWIDRWMWCWMLMHHLRIWSGNNLLDCVAWGFNSKGLFTIHALKYSKHLKNLNFIALHFNWVLCGACFTT